MLKLWQWFDKEVGKVIVTGNIADVNLPLLDGMTDLVVFHINMLHSVVIDPLLSLCRDAGSSTSILISANAAYVHCICSPAHASAMYSVSVMDVETMDCNFMLQLMGPPAWMYTLPDMDLCMSISAAKLEL